MTSSQLSYAAYSSHRRGPSSSSVKLDREGIATNDGQRAVDAVPGNASLQSPTIFVSNTSAAEKMPATMTTNVHTVPPLRRASTQTVSSNDGPPPLRTISSLRSAATSSSSASASSLLRGTAKGEGSSSDAVSNRLTAPDASPSNALSSSRRAVSSSLKVPPLSNGFADSTSSTTLDAVPSAKTISHAKRHSFSPSNATSATVHVRSASSSVIPPNLPHHMSTAQRLRSVNPTSTQSGSSSRASSPSGTPRGLSPSLEAMMDRNLPRSSSYVPFDAEAIGRRTTYRPGFQPKGAYRVRTDEYIAARERTKDGKSGSSSIQLGEETKARTELESQRLERRLEKLLALYYESVPISLESMPSWMPNALRKTRQIAEEERRIREEEMRIVKWEEDSTRKICPLCQTPFSLSLRKHHCRLCGRIVCASPHLSQPPGTDANRNSKEGNTDGKKCSSLMVADGVGGTIIKDMARWEDRDQAEGGVIKEVAEGGKRGMRICRECRETIMHRQYMLDDGSIPAYLRLYEALVTLQKEIEQSLPEFTEMVLGLQKQDAAAALGTNASDERSEDILSPNKEETDAAQARKQLLANFANYDLVAKKIRNLDDAGNVSLARIKMAIWTKANLFLQQNMFPLQSLPKTSPSKKEKPKAPLGTNTPMTDNRFHLIDAPLTSSSSNNSQGSSTPSSEAKANARTIELVKNDPKAAKESLVVLEQQLSLVLEYAASAAKARKFQDAKALKSSAQDLDAEIARLRKLGVS
ncbi:hypothetical protein CBS101457_006408 [Exobasidium rhododendri]|nr:hypothetical protein CBS101457_006408 [Exobasidium rhododendri]